MRLQHLVIHNFRGILHQEIEVEPYTLLVGPNNAGKSTVIDAIRAFYDEGVKFSDTDWPYTTVASNDRTSWIEVTFALTEEEWASLAQRYQTPDRSLRIRKVLRADRGARRKSGIMYGYLPNGSLSEEQFYGAKNVQAGKRGGIVYIPAISKVDEHVKLTGPSPLRELLNDIMASVAQDGDAYNRLSESVDSFSTTISGESTADGRSLAGMEKELNSMLQPSWGTQFSLSFETPRVNDLIKNMVKWHFVDDAHGESEDIEQLGSGFQRYFIYSLIRLAAHYVRKPTPQDTAEFSPSLRLVLFEEPEAFLHPQFQAVLTQSLKALTRDADWQVICATHSPHLVSKNAMDIPAIVRLERSDGEVLVHQISSAAWEALVNANLNADWSSPNEQDDHANPSGDEALKYFLWLNTERSAIFFASHVLLVEGPADVALINRLIDSGKIKGDTAGVYVLDCMGKPNIHRFMNLLGSLGVAHSVIHDDDRSKSSGKHPALNATIRESQNAYTRAVEAVAEDVETMLALPKLNKKQRHGKPQQILRHYDDGTIEPERLRLFCELVDRCLPPFE